MLSYSLIPQNGTVRSGLKIPVLPDAETEAHRNYINRTQSQMMDMLSTLPKIILNFTDAVNSLRW